MPLRSNPLTRALRTYNSALYAARATTAAVRSIRNRWHSRQQGQPAKNSSVAKVKAKIAARNPLYANKKLYSKTTAVGQQRRLDLAKQLRAEPRPRRFHSGASAKAASHALPRKPYSGKIAIAKGMTGRQIKRNIVRHNIKKFTSDAVKRTGNRKAAAGEIKAIRKATRTGGYSRDSGTQMTRAQFKLNAYSPHVKAAARLLKRS